MFSPSKIRISFNGKLINHPTYTTASYVYFSFDSRKYISVISSMELGWKSNTIFWYLYQSIRVLRKKYTINKCCWVEFYLLQDILQRYVSTWSKTLLLTKNLWLASMWSFFNNVVSWFMWNASDDWIWLINCIISLSKQKDQLINWYFFSIRLGLEKMISYSGVRYRICIKLDNTVFTV